MRDGVSSKLILPAAAVFVGGAATSLLAWQQTTLVTLYAGLFLTCVVTFLAYVVVIRGQTLRRVHDQATDHERRYRDLLRHADIGFSVTNFAGTILAANEPYAKILGVSSPQELVGRSLADFLGPEDRKRLHDQAIQESYSAADATHITATIIQPGGRQRVVSVSKIVDEHEGEQRVIRLTQDITDRLHAEQDVRSAEVAQRANAVKSAFLASMSHEIRTPLNGVIGNLELLAQTEMRPDQESLLFDAEKASKSLLALIGNILDFSKIEAGKLTVENVEISPAMAVQEAVDIVQSRARQKGIFVSASVAHDVPQVIKGDPTRIRQILLNLLGNAVKFTVSGGVHLSLRVTDDWDENICQLLFVVHDSGRGFRQSHAAQLFQPFTHDYKSAASDFEGTGLGLSICKSLVESFGGEIGCESAPDEGATFWFTIPVQVMTPAAPIDKPDLMGRSVIFIGAPAGDPPQEFKSYLAERHVTVRTVATVDDALAIGREAMAAGRHIDAAVYATAPSTWPDHAMSAALRDHQIVPIALGPDSSYALWRAALRSGAAYLVPIGIDARFLDRNIAQVFGGVAHTQDQVAPELLSGDVSALEGKCVLVLEDRLVNQTIVQRQLKKLGISCVIAGDGIAGLERLAEGGFDLVLCDCSMPRMNGYDFAKNVRQREKANGGHHIPIVAMTANAFREDRDMCFAAGMDDFVSKPVTLPRLASVLTHWLNATDPPSIKDVPVAAEVANGEPLDITRLEALLGGADRRIVLDIVKEFVNAARESWEQVEGCAKSQDTGALTRMAHGAKGEARNAGAAHLGDLYEQLERTAKRNQMAEIPALLTAIPVELTRVEVFVRNLLSEPAS